MLALYQSDGGQYAFFPGCRMFLLIFSGGRGDGSLRWSISRGWSKNRGWSRSSGGAGVGLEAGAGTGAGAGAK